MIDVSTEVMVVPRFDEYVKKEHEFRWEAFIEFASRQQPEVVPVLQDLKGRGVLIAPRPGGQGYRFVPDPSVWNSEEEFQTAVLQLIGAQGKAIVQLLDHFQEKDEGPSPSSSEPHRVVETVEHVQWEVIQSPEDIRRVCAEARNTGICALDTETAPGPHVEGLDVAWLQRAPLDPHLGRIRLLQIAVPNRPVALIDLSAWWDHPEALREVLSPVAELLADAQTTKIAYNATFDLKMLRSALGGVMRPIANMFDPMLAAQLLACGIWPAEGDGFKLESVVARELGVKLDKTAQRSDWSQNLTNEQIRYAAVDAAVLLPLYEALLKRLHNNGLLRAAMLEFECLPATADLEWAGMPFDREAWLELKEQEEKAIEEALVDIAERFSSVISGQLGLFGPTFNPSSPYQVLDGLRKLGADIENTEDTTLVMLVQQGGPAGHAAEAILRFRKHNKRLRSMIYPYLELQHPLTKRIHSNYKQLNPNGVGRFSASNPNIQQVDRGDAFRRAFKAPEGRALVIADYSAIEMRVMAWLSRDPVLMEVFKTGVDPHRRTASLIMNKFEDEVSKAERQMAKACFSGDTEILTPKGWVRFDEYDGVTPVAQYSLPEGLTYNPSKGRSNRWGLPTDKVAWDGQGGTIEFVRPLAFEKFEDRELWHQEDRNTDLLLTDDHEVIFIDTNKRPRKMPAREVHPGSARYIIAAGHLNITPKLSEVETRLLAMILADGSLVGDGEVKGVRFGFTKQRKIERCRWLLDQAGIQYNESLQGSGVTRIYFRSPELWERLSPFIDSGKSLSWACIGNIDGRIYLEEAAYWDGSMISLQRSRKRRVRFSTTDRQTAEVMQALAVLSGIPSVLYSRTSHKTNHSVVYLLSYKLEGAPTWRVSWDLRRTGKKDTVYCVQVPSGAIVVRRNGRVAIMGNCNFGLIYGMSPGTLQLYANVSYGAKMSESEAKAFRQRFFEVYAGVACWHERQNTIARKKREIRTASGRARRWLSTDMPPTVLYNSPDQGTGADILKRAMARLRPHLMRYGAELVASVHDELVVECDEDKAEAFAEVMKREMEAAGAEFIAPVPVEVEVGIGKSWADKG